MTEINAKNFTENLYRFNDLYKDIQEQIEDKESRVNWAKKNLEKMKEESTVVDDIEKLKQEKEELKSSMSKIISTTDEKWKIGEDTKEEREKLSNLNQKYSYIQHVLEGLCMQIDIKESDNLKDVRLRFSDEIKALNNELVNLEREKNELYRKSKDEIIVKANKINNYIDNFDTVIEMKKNLDNIMKNINSKQIDLGDLGNILTYFYINSANNKNNKTIIGQFLGIANRLSNDKLKDELVKECVMYSILVYNQSVEKEEQNMNKLKEFFRKSGFDIEKFKNNNQDLNADLQIELEGLKEICNNLNNGLGKTAYNPKELNYFS